MPVPPEEGLTHSWWDHLAAQAAGFSQAGFTAIWLPPVTKGASGEASVGYDVFDDYDLGSKNQKGTVADGVLTLPPRLPPGGFQRAYISQEDCLGSNPAKWRGFLHSNRRCGSSRVHLWLIRLSYARWEQAYFP
jgi:hypothetical protein